MRLIVERFKKYVGRNKLVLYVNKSKMIMVFRKRGKERRYKWKGVGVQDKIQTVKEWKYL